MAIVLVVDDDQPIIDLLVEVVTDAGHTVLTARHGLEALARAYQQPPALIISDVMMPIMDGYALLDAVRADPALAHIRMILMSAAVASISSPATVFVPKPLDLPLIEEFLQQLL